MNEVATENETRRRHVSLMESSTSSRSIELLSLLPHAQQVPFFLMRPKVTAPRLNANNTVTHNNNTYNNNNDNNDNNNENNNNNNWLSAWRARVGRIGRVLPTRRVQSDAEGSCVYYRTSFARAPVQFRTADYRRCVSLYTRTMDKQDSRVQ